MNKSQFWVLLFFIGLLIFQSCEENTVECLQNDWIGSYSGTITSFSGESDILLQITAQDNTFFRIEYTTASGDTTAASHSYRSVGCMLSSGIPDFTQIGEEGPVIPLHDFSGTLDGDRLTLSVDYRYFYFSDRYTINATKN